MIPDTLLQVAIFALFVAPGIMFATVRVSLVGFRGPNPGAASRVLEALFVGVLFDALYVLIFYQFVIGVVRSPIDAIEHMSEGQAAWAVFLILVLPGFVAAGVSLRFRRSAPDPTTSEGKKFAKRQAEKFDKRVTHSKKRHWYRANGYRSTPLAWDSKALNMPVGQFVRVRTEAGEYYGGWYSGDSYMSTYPQPRDIYIASQWEMTAAGDFVGSIPRNAGVWLSITDKCVVDWFEASPEPEIETEEKQ